MLEQFLWVNHNNSLAWIQATKGDDSRAHQWFPVRSQWGRYNLPRFHVWFKPLLAMERIHAEVMIQLLVEFCGSISAEKQGICAKSGSPILGRKLLSYPKNNNIIMYVYLHVYIHIYIYMIYDIWYMSETYITLHCIALYYSTVQYSTLRLDIHAYMHACIH